MSPSDQDRQRNREIAENEADRQMIGDVRVSVWAIAVAVIAGVIVFGIAWAWLNRRAQAFFGMISATNAFRACREGKPESTFRDHALE